MSDIKEKKPIVQRVKNLQSNDTNLASIGSLWQKPLAFEVFVFISRLQPLGGARSADI